MTQEIQDVIDQLVVIQAAITPPTGEKDIAIATDELPPDLTVFPTFLNVETSTEVEYSPSRRVQVHLIDMNLVFAPAVEKYSMRSRRAWVQKVMDAFAAKVTLNGACNKARILSITYETPLQWNDIPFMTATFRLEAVNIEAVTFSA